MDPLKLLSRSTNVLKRDIKQRPTTIPSNGSGSRSLSPAFTQSKKRKRGQEDEQATHPGLDFFAGSIRGAQGAPDQSVEHTTQLRGREEHSSKIGSVSIASRVQLSEEECRAVLRKHKLKITWLNPALSSQSKKIGRKEKAKVKVAQAEKPYLYPQPLQAFGELSQRCNISTRLMANIVDEGYTVPTEVQLGALPLLLEEPACFLPDRAINETGDINLLTVAPTGSGKTLAFMVPLMQKILKHRRARREVPSTTHAVILAPTKELVSQTINEGRKLALGTGIRIAQVRKGMQLANSNGRRQQSEDLESLEDISGSNATVKADILVSTPGTLATIVENSEVNVLADVRHLVLDEADVLLDPLFREQTLTIWNALANADLRISLWSATMGSNIEELAKTTISDRQKRLTRIAGATILEAPLVRLVVGLKDSAVPTVQHKLIYAATEHGKLMGLRQLLHPTTSSAEADTPLRPPFLVFTQTIERAVALHSELMYDIPAEAGGITRIAVLHSDLSDTARDSVMTRFRKGEVWVLITTDLLSRGVDFRGINGVVNYDIPTSSSAYVHRVGRTGRAGREGGIAITLYSKDDIPYLKHVANVVSMVEKQKGERDGVQQWLLDALPSLSKQDKQKFKKRGMDIRTARGKDQNPKAARKARISTKAGFERRTDNNRKGAIAGSQRRIQRQAALEAADETDFDGFQSP